MSFFEKCFSKKAQKRNPSFELLRLYSTFLVILRHIRFFVYRVTQGGREYNNVMFMQSLTSICDNEFILLSGYFGCQKDIKISRFIPILLQNLTYSIGFYLFAVYIGWSKFTWIELSKHFFPITFTVYWFTAPFLFSQIIFRPIYKGLKAIGRKYHFFLCLCAFFVATIASIGLGEHIAIWGDGTNINLFAIFLIYGSYLGLYDISFPFSICLICTVLFSTIHYLGLIGFFNKFFEKDSFCQLICKNDHIFSPFVTFISIFVFLMFKRIEVPATLGKIINFMSDFNYGIYTGHCHYHVIFHIMRKFTPTVTEHRPHYWMYMIRDTFIIYAGCFVIELIRSMIFNFCIFNRNYYEKICSWVDSLLEEGSKENNNEQEVILTMADNVEENVPAEEEMPVKPKLETKMSILNNNE